jgi:8-oxo-dGTP pyrophosphatase MutT (NUDIX family)
MITLFKKFNEKNLLEEDLAGIVLILDNQMLLVNAKKYKNIPNKWSIPKGHIETYVTALETAITELREEANIKLPIFKFKEAITDKLSYVKNIIQKNLTYYVLTQ